MESMIEFVHQRIKKHKYQNGIDFTMGNGHDTLFLVIIVIMFIVMIFNH